MISKNTYTYTTIFYCEMQYFLQPFYINGEISENARQNDELSKPGIEIV